MKTTTILALTALSCAGNLLAVPIYDTGFTDPVWNMDVSQRWFDAGLSQNPTLADNFTLSQNAVAKGGTIWTYDTADGTPGALVQLNYAIYAGATQPTGAPIASGAGQIVSSLVLDGHRSPFDPLHPASSIDNRQMVIQTVFNFVSPVHLAPDVTYWLAVVAGTVPLGVNCSAQWAIAGNDPAQTGSYMALGANGWTEIAKGNRALELEGEGIPHAGVPDGGSTLCLLALALAPLSLRRLRAGRV